MKFYNLNLRVAEDALGETITAITSLIGAGLVVLGTIEPIVELPAKQPRKKQTGGTSPAEQTRLGRVVLDALKTGQCSIQEIGEEITKHGFSANSVSPICSKLIKDNLIERDYTLLNGVRTTVFRLRHAAAKQ